MSKERELPPEDIARCVIPGEVRVDAVWIGEGLDGDYQGPPDTPVVRIDVFNLKQDPDAEEAAYSYATALSAFTPPEVVESVCCAIAESLIREARPRGSLPIVLNWKHQIEEWTWVNEQKAWHIHKDRQGRGKRWRMKE